MTEETLKARDVEIKELQKECGDLEDKYQQMMAERNAYVADLQAEFEGSRKLRQKYGAKEDETMFGFIERLWNEKIKANAERNEYRLSAESYEKLYVSECEKNETLLRELGGLQISLAGEIKARRREWDMKADEVAKDKIVSLEARNEALQEEHEKDRHRIEFLESRVEALRKERDWLKRDRVQGHQPPLMAEGNVIPPPKDTKVSDPCPHADHDKPSGLVHKSRYSQVLIEKEQLKVAVQDLLSELRIGMVSLQIMADGYSPDYPGIDQKYKMKNPPCAVQLSQVVATKLLECLKSDMILVIQKDS